MAAHVRDQMILLLPRLRRFARALAGSKEDADDLVQDTVERALRSIGTWEPNSRLDSWMFRILRNLWIDRLRRRKAERIDRDAEVSADIAGEDGRRTAEGRLALAEVQNVIAGLPEQQREVLALVCVEDLSYREAAEILDVPMGTVMSRLARARQALAATLGEGGRAALPPRQESAR